MRVDWHHLLRNQQTDGCRTGVPFGKAKPTIPHISTTSPGRQMGRHWSAKPIIRGFNPHPGVQPLQRSLTAKPQAHNLVNVGSTPTAATMRRWCNGSIRVSKTFGSGSNPGLCVLRRALIREAYILVIRLNREVSSNLTASSHLGAEKTASLTCTL